MRGFLLASAIIIGAVVLFAAAEEGLSRVVPAVGGAGLVLLAGGAYWLGTRNRR